jgi:hypothetical protein
MIEILRAFPTNDRSGDVYAVRTDQLASFTGVAGEQGG